LFSKNRAGTKSNTCRKTGNVRRPVITEVFVFGAGEVYAVLRQEEGMGILKEGRNKIMKRKLDKNKEQIKGRRKVRTKKRRKVGGDKRRRRRREEINKRSVIQL
jgi:hypothetical protein